MADPEALRKFLCEFTGVARVNLGETRCALFYIDPVDLLAEGGEAPTSFAFVLRPTPEHAQFAATVAKGLWNSRGYNVAQVASYRTKTGFREDAPFVEVLSVERRI
jgi:hypothetical protein